MRGDLGAYLRTWRVRGGEEDRAINVEGELRGDQGELDVDVEDEGWKGYSSCGL